MTTRTSLKLIMLLFISSFFLTAAPNARAMDVGVSAIPLEMMRTPGSDLVAVKAVCAILKAGGTALFHKLGRGQVPTANKASQ